MSNEIEQYASDLTDDQWARIEPFTKRPDPRGAVRIYEMRDVVNAILYLTKTGCQWRMIPIHFPPWQTVYAHFRSMRDRGVWENLCRELNKANREKKGRTATPSYLLVDSQSVKTNYEAEEVGFHGGKKVKGRSRQVAVDTQGFIWGVHVHAANGSDTVEGCVLADLVLSELPSVKAVCADSGYKGTFVTYLEEDWKMPVHITEREGNGFQLIAKRWIVERTFSWNNGQRRLSKDYEKKTESSESFVYLAAISRGLRQSVN